MDSGPLNEVLVCEIFKASFRITLRRNVTFLLGVCLSNRMIEVSSTSHIHRKGCHFYSTDRRILTEQIPPSQFLRHRVNDYRNTNHLYSIRKTYIQPSTYLYLHYVRAQYIHEYINRSCKRVNRIRNRGYRMSIISRASRT